MSDAASEQAPLTVAVLGSCITRDNFNTRFNPDYKRWYVVGATTNQSSMIALMSPPVDEPWQPVKPMERYGRWNVASDLSREILTLLAEAPPDLLVLDFFGDVHFGVVRMADGRYVTDNRWKLPKTDLYARLKADPATEFLSWRTDEEGYFALWTEAMDRFAAYVARHCPQTRVVVHWGFDVAAVLRPAKPFPVPARFPGLRARKVNAFWARLSAHASTAYGWESIDLRDEWYVSFTEHPWGAFQVHYTMDYYRRFQAELHRIALRDRVDPELAERLDVLGRAAHRRVMRELTHWRALGRRQPQPAGRLAQARRWLRRTAESLAPPPTGERPRQLLAELEPDLDPADFERVAQLVQSADEHAAWIREVWQCRLAAQATAR